MKDRELALFLRWLLKHYSTSTIDGMFGYVDSMGREVNIQDIINHYKEYQLQPQEISDEEYPELEGTINLCNDIISKEKISDEEIFNYAERYRYTNGKLSFRDGAKWMREKLRKYFF